jgi:glucose-6-phosphate 1-dehydrogenase
MTETAQQPTQQEEENPLAEGLALRRTPDPCALVIFGASGDLTHKKIMPALYALFVRQLLPPRFAIVGVARTDGDDDSFRQDMEAAVKQHARDPFRQDVWDTLAEQLHYVAMDFADTGGEDKLHSELARFDEEQQLGGNSVFYLAVPPPAFPMIVRALGKRRDERGWTRVVVEKPFGHDLASAKELTALLLEYFREDEIFRIDHYLGKETVQNMLALRFANGIFEPIWNRQFVDHVEITVAESIGIEARAGYYEQAGAIRDIFQNHLLQLLALTAMEPPIDFMSDAVHNEKVKVLRALHTPAPRSVVRGQYGRGFIEGEEVVAYREEEGVAPDSMTETFVAAKLFVDNWRWADTPFYVRMGKRLARQETTIAIEFKRAPHPPFEETAAEGVRPNVLVVHVQPDEGVSLAIGAKVPGQGLTIRTVHMDFLYGGTFRTGMPEAYERLILDVMLGDSTLFTRTDEVEEQWKLVDAIIAGWQRDKPAFPNYAAGSWGPPSAEELMQRDGRSWRLP